MRRIKQNEKQIPDVTNFVKKKKKSTELEDETPGVSGLANKIK